MYPAWVYEHPDMQMSELIWELSIKLQLSTQLNPLFCINLNGYKWLHESKHSLKPS